MRVHVKVDQIGCYMEIPELILATLWIEHKIAETIQYAQERGEKKIEMKITLEIDKE